MKMYEVEGVALRMYEGYSVSNIRSAVTRRSNEKKIIYKNAQILKLLLKIVAAGIEALVLYAACELSHV
jgi:hypothetical protein